MKSDDVRQLYDAAYARTYEDKFIHSPLTKRGADLDMALLRSLITDRTKSWLDCACGTGYFLRHFPHVLRVGIDLSPAMLDRARENNPDVRFVEHDFRNPQPEWSGRFGLVSCMWYAYTLVDTMTEVCQVIGNLASWTASDGTCFMPLADPRLLARRDLPYHIEDNFDGQTTLTGILWSYAEDDGAKLHYHLVTPQVEFVVEQFQRHFDDVRVVRHPAADGRATGRPAIIATKKR
jgi:SAM-dependent methyltransferase